jgi:phosphomevalonate kinase
MIHLSNSSLEVQVPGKLMIAGEFAVLEPYHKLLAMAVNRFVTVKIEASQLNQITLEKFQLSNLPWHVNENEVSIESTDKRVNFVQEAMTTAIIYLKENNISSRPFRIHVRSDLDDKVSGKKFGLGSSAAVVVGVITAILKWHLEEEPSPELVFKLASISHVAAQGNGSGADVAASAYGGIIQYSSFQAEWLRDQYNQSHSLTELLETDWKYFSVNPIELPKVLHLCIGWTGSPASTGSLVEEIKGLKKTNPDKYQRFLDSSEEAVDNILKGIYEDNLPQLFNGIKQNRAALVTVGKDANLELETSMITELCNLAEEHGGAAKQSGAGGGDCGIAFMPTKESAEQLVEAWKNEGIIPLTIQPYLNKSPKI